MRITECAVIFSFFIFSKLQNFKQMKNTILKFGTYSGGIALLCFLAALYFGKGASFTVQEIIGYTTIVVALSFIYFGIKYYRDQKNNGHISIGKGIAIGLGIAAFAAAGIAIADFIYTAYINPDFFKEYAETMKAQGSQEPIPDYGSGFMAMIMFITVMLIGLVISLISALLLQRKN